MTALAFSTAAPRTRIYPPDGNLRLVSGESDRPQRHLQLLTLGLREGITSQPSLEWSCQPLSRAQWEHRAPDRPALHLWGKNTTGKAAGWESAWCERQTPFPSRFVPSVPNILAPTGLVHLDPTGSTELAATTTSGSLWTLCQQTAFGAFPNIVPNKSSPFAPNYRKHTETIKISHNPTTINVSRISCHSFFLCMCMFSLSCVSPLWIIIAYHHRNNLN